jgi:hypothetical protein
MAPASHAVDRCPNCTKQHAYRLVVETSVLTFAGPSTDSTGAGTAGRGWDVEFRCPKTRRLFTERVTLTEQPGMRVLSVRSELPESDPVPDWREAEVAEWIKSSAGTGRDFCRTMVGAGTAAIPLYFAVLKYLGLENAHGGWRAATIGPPVLFLAATVAFVVALRPVLRPVDVTTIETARDQRLRTMNRAITVGLVLVGLALVHSLVLFLVLLWR